MILKSTISQESFDESRLQESYLISYILKKKKDELIDSWHVVTDSRSKVLSANQTAEFLNQLNSK